jgi:hypothetical protein
MTDEPPRAATTTSLRLLSHVHTRRSADAWLTPRQIVAFARAAQIDVVLVTDHDSHMGSVDCQRLAGEHGPVFPVSAEYRSTQGDMIATLLSGPIKSREPRAIIAETHEQGGLVILPHPYKASRFADEIFELADLIEIYNARSSDEQNARAAATAEALRKPTLASPDAHLQRELGLALNEFVAVEGRELRDALLHSERRFVTGKTTMRAIHHSQILKSMRRLQPIRFAKGMVRWFQVSADDQP